MAVAVLGFSAQGASAAKYKKLYDFCSEANCADGARPTATLAQDAAGNLYGTAPKGGDAGAGVVFKLTKTAHGYKYSRLYSFCSQAGCADGGGPHGKLVVDVNGNIYGAATDSGPHDGGVIFELIGQKTYKILYAACAKTDCIDGHDPVALTYQGAASGAAYDGTSPLYGGNCCGGVDQNGAVFKLTPSGAKWKLTTLYVFCKKNCKVGDRPTGDLLVDGTGTLIGAGQSLPSGTLYKLTGAGKAKLLHKFCTGGNGCPDGDGAAGGVTVDAAGVLYGTTTAGGGQDNAGVVYKVDPHAGYSVVADFDASTGSQPSGTPAMDANGTLYGVTGFGGPNFGNIWSLKNGVLSDIFDLCGFEACGSFPVAGLAIDGSGNLFGTTRDGGVNDDGSGSGAGTLFEYTP